MFPWHKIWEIAHELMSEYHQMYHRIHGPLIGKMAKSFRHFQNTYFDLKQEISDNSDNAHWSLKLFQPSENLQKHVSMATVKSGKVLTSMHLAPHTHPALSTGFMLHCSLSLMGNTIKENLCMAGVFSTCEFLEAH